MIMNPTIYRLFCPDVADPGVDDLARASQALNALPVPWVEAATSATPCSGWRRTRPAT